MAAWGARGARAGSGAATTRARRSDPLAWVRRPAPQRATDRQAPPPLAIFGSKIGAAAAACSQTVRSRAATLAARPDIPDGEGMGMARTLSRARFARWQWESRLGFTINRGVFKNAT